MQETIERPGAASTRTGPRWVRRPAAAALVGFLVVLTGGFAAVQALPTRYAATSFITFLPRPDANIAADTVTLVGQKYVVVATSIRTLRAAGARVGSTAADLTTRTTAVLVAGTGNVEVTVTLADRDRAANAANAVVATLVRDAVNDPIVQAEATAPAVAGSAHPTPPRMLLRIASLLAAGLAGALAWTVAAGATRRREAGAAWDGAGDPDGARSTLPTAPHAITPGRGALTAAGNSTRRQDLP